LKCVPLFDMRKYSYEERRPFIRASGVSINAWKSLIVFARESMHRKDDLFKVVLAPYAE